MARCVCGGVGGEVCVCVCLSLSPCSQGSSHRLMGRESWWLLLLQKVPVEPGRPVLASEAQGSSRVPVLSLISSRPPSTPPAVSLKRPLAQGITRELLTFLLGTHACLLGAFGL